MGKRVRAVLREGAQDSGHREGGRLDEWLAVLGGAGVQAVQPLGTQLCGLGQDTPQLAARDLERTRALGYSIVVTP